MDKIVGPGNAYVAAAKRRVFGVVGIDMVAGPSEILVICDGTADPDWIAMDLFSQAEHDELAQAILLCPDAAFIDAVAASIDRLLPQMPRRDSDRRLAAGPRRADRGARPGRGLRASPTASRRNTWSCRWPTRRARRPQIRHAGAIFMGGYTCEALGDYCAGPNHVLPTSRTRALFVAAGRVRLPEALAA